MHNSQKKPWVLSRAQFNTHNSQTPTKKTVPCSQTNANNESSCQSMSKHNKNSSYENTQVGSGVSYSQLQIILENVQQVKKKATEQLQALEKNNVKLEQELRAARDQLKRYENLEDTIKEETMAAERKYQLEIRATKDKIGEMEANCGLLSDRITELTQQLDKMGANNEMLRSQLQKNSKQSSSYQQRYRSLTTSLQINQQGNEIKQIREQYSGIPQLLAHLAELKTKNQHLTAKLEQDRRANQELREQVAQGNKIIDTITDENRHLLDLIEELRSEKESLSKSITVIQTEKVTVMRQKQCTLLEIEDQILNIRKASDQQITQREHIIADMKQQIAKLKETLRQYESREKVWKQESEFKAMVDEVCDQHADYEKVLKRIQYLEKYRTEYYFNIEKIQFLCKILDS